MSKNYESITVKSYLDSNVPECTSISEEDIQIELTKFLFKKNNESLVHFLAV